LAAIQAIEPDLEWRLDHGAWSFLLQMYPEANIPVFQLSLDRSKSLRAHFELAAQLTRLRDKGVLIIGSGNLVHNLGTMTWNAKPFEWALEFDNLIAAALLDRNYKTLIEVHAFGPLTHVAHPTLEHFLPVFYTVVVAHRKDEFTFFNEAIDLGSISMRSFVLN
jgi:4,5-DOPA dioxygenase extradiol